MPNSGSLQLSGDFTVSAWFNLDAAGLASNVNGILGTRLGQDQTFDVKVDGLDGKIHGDVGTGSNWINTGLDINNLSINPGQWYMVTYVITPTGAQLYFNGVDEQNYTWAATNPTFMTAAAGADADRPKFPDEYMNGSIDNVYVFGRRAEPHQVAAVLANPGNLPVTTPMQIAAGATSTSTGTARRWPRWPIPAVRRAASSPTKRQCGGDADAGRPAGDRSLFSGSIQDSARAGAGGMSLVLNGSGTQILTGSNTYGGSTVVASGTLILSGSDSYTGGTYVDNGVLIVTAASALPTGTSLTVGAGGTFIFDPMATAAPVAASPAGAVAAVPEPASLVLLGVGALALLGYRRRRRS